MLCFLVSVVALLSLWPMGRLLLEGVAPGRSRSFTAWGFGFYLSPVRLLFSRWFMGDRGFSHGLGWGGLD